MSNIIIVPILWGKSMAGFKAFVIEALLGKYRILLRRLNNYLNKHLENIARCAYTDKIGMSLFGQMEIYCYEGQL